MDRESLADVTQSLPDAVVVIDQMGGVLWTNDAAERLFGRTGGEAGRDERSRRRPRRRQGTGRGRPHEHPGQVGGHADRAAGSCRRGLEARRGDRLQSARAQVPVGGLVLCIRDLTERRRWEVANSEVGRFRSLVHNAASIIMLLEPTGEIESVSAAITRLLGHDQELVEGRAPGRLRRRTRPAGVVVGARPRPRRSRLEHRPDHRRSRDAAARRVGPRFPSSSAS